MTGEFHSPGLQTGDQKSPVSEHSLITRWGVHPWGYALLVLAVIFFTYQVIGSIITIVIFKSAEITPENVQWIRLETFLAQVVLLLVPTLVLARLQTRNLRTIFKLKLPSLWSVFYGLVGLISLQQILEVYLSFQDAIPIPQSLKPVIDEYRKMVENVYSAMIASHSVPELLFVVAVVALAPAVCEELLFRGLVQDNFEKGSSKRWYGFVITGAIFGIYHLNLFAVVPLIALGMYFGYIVYYSRSILIAMTAHFVNNTLAILAAYFRIDENMASTLATGRITLSGELLNLFFFTILFIASMIGFRRSAGVRSGSMPETGSTEKEG